MTMTCPTLSHGFKVCMVASGVMDRRQDEVIPLSDLARLLPTPKTRWTLWYWATKGATSVSGATVKLKTVKLTGGLGSSMSRYQEFLDELNR